MLHVHHAALHTPCHVHHAALHTPCQRCHILPSTHTLSCLSYSPQTHPVMSVMLPPHTHPVMSIILPSTHTLSCLSYSLHTHPLMSIILLPHTPCHLYHTTHSKHSVVSVTLLHTHPVNRKHFISPINDIVLFSLKAVYLLSMSLTHDILYLSMTVFYLPLTG